MADKPTHNPRYSFVEVDNERILYDTGTKNVIYLDVPGAMVWALCNGERDTEEIAELLARAYPEDGQKVRNDVRRTIQLLVGQGPLELRE